MKNIAYVFATLVLTIYGQIIIKARVLHHTEGVTERGYIPYLFTVFTDPWVISGFAAAVLAAMCWLLALRGVALSFLYPFMALSFVFVPLFAALLFGEKIGPMQIIGLILIVGGVSLATFTR